MARLEKIRVRHPFPAIQIMFYMELRARDRARAQSQEPGWLMRDHGGFPFEKPGMVGRSRLRAGLSPHREYRAVVRAALNHHQPVYQRADVQAFEKRTPFGDIGDGSLSTDYRLGGPFAGRACEAVDESDIELALRGTQPLAQALFKRMLAIAPHGERKKAAARPEITRQPFDDATNDLLTILAAAIEDEVRAVHRDVRRMGHDPVEGELASRLVQIALRSSEIRDAVETAVELRKDSGARSDVKRVRVYRASARGQQSGDPRSRAEIEKRIAGAG